MNRLQKELAGLPVKKPAAKRPVPKDVTSDVSEQREPVLLISKWNDVVWVLPWAYFLGAQYRPQVESPHHPGELVEQIELVFAQQTVTVKGRNLKSLTTDAIARLQGHLRELPKDFLLSEPKKDDAAPVIIDIDVQVREK